MGLRLNINTLKNILIYSILFLAAMNFYAKFFYFCFAALLLLLLIQRRVLVDRTSLIYLALGLLLAVYNYREGVLSMIRCFAFISLYWVGYNLMIARRSDGNANYRYGTDHAQNRAFSLLTTISLGSFAHYLVNYIYNYGADIGRNTNDIWMGSVMAATGQAALSSLMIGFSVAMILAPVKKKYRLAGIICIILIFAYDLVLACRTVPAMFLIILLAGLLYTYRTKKSSQDRLKLAIGTVAALLLILAVFAFDIGGISQKLFVSNLFERFNTTSTATSRLHIKMSYLAEWWRYPFGGLHLRTAYGYAHDLLLDGYDEYGVAGFVLFLTLLILGIRELYKYLRYTSYSFENKTVVLCVYLAILIEFSIEPVLTGMPWLVACYCLVNGCIKGMNVTYAEVKRSAE